MSITKLEGDGNSGNVSMSLASACSVSPGSRLGGWAYRQQRFFRALQALNISGILTLNFLCLGN